MELAKPLERRGPGGALDPEILALLDDIEAFGALDRSDRLLLASRATIVSLSRGSVLFREGDEDPWLYCLVGGSVDLVAANGRGYRVDAADTPDRHILSRLKPRCYTATAAAPSRLLRIDGQGIGNWHAAIDPAAMQLEELADAGMEVTMDAAGWTDRTTEAAEDFELPSIPAIALRTRALIDRDDCDAGTIAKALMNDPAITAKLIKAANSPLFYGTSAVGTCERAIVRLGLLTARQLILAFAMGELFETSESAVSSLARELWEHSTQVAAMAFVLARRLECFDPGEAQLAGLLHDVGVIPVLNRAATDPRMLADTDSLMRLACRQRGPLGARILERWHFPEPVVTAAREADDWWRDPGAAADLADLVVVSQLLSFIGTPRIVDVPPVIKVPAFARLLGQGLDPSAVLRLVEEADEQVREIRAVLRG